MNGKVKLANSSNCGFAYTFPRGIRDYSERKNMYANTQMDVLDNLNLGRKNNPPGPEPTSDGLTVRCRI
jgi:hypothetical protein